MWPNSSETQELVEGARGGDAAAVNRLLERHRAALRRMVDMRIDPVLERRVDASDIVQEVLVEANRRLSDYLQAEPMPFHLWLRSLARDRLIDAHRRHRVAARRSIDREQPLAAKRAPDRSTLELIDELCDPGLTPAAAALREEMAAQFREALDQLSETDREIVLMRHFEHLTNQEIAQALDLTEAAASMRYLRAIKRLRGVLENTGDQST